MDAIPGISQPCLESNTCKVIARFFDQFTTGKKSLVLTDHPANDTVDPMFFFFRPPQKLRITLNGNCSGNLQTHSVS